MTYYRKDNKFIKETNLNFDKEKECEITGKSYFKGIQIHSTAGLFYSPHYTSP